MSNTVPLIQVSLEKLVKTYIKIRDRRAEIKRAYEEEDGGLVSQLDTVKSALLDHCKAHNVTSVKTSEGLFYRTVSQKYWTSDWEEMHKFVMKHEVPEFLEKRLNQTAVREFLEENPDDAPKGINVDSEYTISVRKK